MSLSHILWTLDIVAQSSIVHRDSYSSPGTTTGAVFRTERIYNAATGEIQPVPIVSGSSFRGILRRIGEELTAEVLDYEDVALPVPAAHMLTNGGKLAKSATPFTDEDERELKALFPLIALFGGAASNRLMSGLLVVSKVLPVVAELAHILPHPPKTAIPDVGSLITGESFSHLSDHRPHTAQPPCTDDNDTTNPLGLFTVETLPAGTVLQASVRLRNATDHQVAFMRDILDVFAHSGHLGGRISAGNGAVTATVTPTVVRGQLPGKRVNWRTALTKNRAEAVALLSKIT